MPRKRGPRRRGGASSSRGAADSSRGAASSSRGADATTSTQAAPTTTVRSLKKRMSAEKWTIEEIVNFLDLLDIHEPDYSDTDEWWGRITPHMPGRSVHQLRCFLSFCTVRESSPFPAQGTSQDSPAADIPTEEHSVESSQGGGSQPPLFRTRGQRSPPPESTLTASVKTTPPPSPRKVSLPPSPQEFSPKTTPPPSPRDASPPTIPPPCSMNQASPKTTPPPSTSDASPSNIPPPSPPEATLKTTPTGRSPRVVSPTTIPPSSPQLDTLQTTPPEPSPRVASPTTFPPPSTRNASRKTPPLSPREGSPPTIQPRSPREASRKTSAPPAPSARQVSRPTIPPPLSASRRSSTPLAPSPQKSPRLAISAPTLRKASSKTSPPPSLRKCEPKTTPSPTAREASLPTPSKQNKAFGKWTLQESRFLISLIERYKMKVHRMLSEDQGWKVLASHLPNKTARDLSRHVFFVQLAIYFMEKLNLKSKESEAAPAVDVAANSPSAEASSSQNRRPESIPVAARTKRPTKVSAASTSGNGSTSRASNQKISTVRMDRFADEEKAALDPCGNETELAPVAPPEAVGTCSDESELQQLWAPGTLVIFNNRGEHMSFPTMPQAVGSEMDSSILSRDIGDEPINEDEIEVSVPLGRISDYRFLSPLTATSSGGTSEMSSPRGAGSNHGGEEDVPDGDLVN